MTSYKQLIERFILPSLLELKKLLDEGEKEKYLLRETSQMDALIHVLTNDNNLKARDLHGRPLKPVIDAKEGNKQ